MAQGRRPAAQTALLIVAPLVLLGYGAVGGWLWWADQQDQPASPAMTEAAAPETETPPEPASEAAATAPESPQPSETDDVAAQQHASDDADHAQPDADRQAASDPGVGTEDTAHASAEQDRGPGATDHASTDEGHGRETHDGKAHDQDDHGEERHGESPDSDRTREADEPDGHSAKDDNDQGGQAAEPDRDGHSPGEDHDKASDADRAAEPETPAVPAMPTVEAPAEPEPATPAPTLSQRPVRPTLPPLPDVASTPLAPAPDPALVGEGRYGPLPIRADDGREPWQVYGRPFDRRADARIIALVITELGLAEPATLSAIQDLPGEITLAFSPYSRRLDEWIPAARAAGHEVLLEVPMEPRNLDLNDPGDKALLTTNSPEVNLDRLEWVMARSSGYVGLTSFMGSRLTVSENDMRPILDAVGARGLAWVDPKVTPVSVAAKLARELGLPAAASDRAIDQQAAREPIDRRLLQLEQIALSRGSAVGFAQAYPVTIERLRAWIPEMRKRGFELAPITAVVDR